jgi:hypothetical protein
MTSWLDLELLATCPLDFSQLLKTVQPETLLLWQ